MVHEALAVISVTVALLGGPQWVPGTPLVSQRMVFKGSGGVIEIPVGDVGGRRLQGQCLYYFAPSPLLATGVQPLGRNTMYDSDADLTTIIGPDEATIKELFEKSVRGEAHMQTATIEVDPQSWNWEQRKFEFLWPEDRPQYYLEKLPGLYLGYPVYGRIELVDKEGYTVSVQPTGGPDELAVQVEFANNTLSGGKYDETIRAYVGRPVLIKTVVSTTAPLNGEQPTLLVWQPSSAIARAAYRDDSAALSEYVTRLSKNLPVLSRPFVAVGDPSGQLALGVVEAQNVRTAEQVHKLLQ